MSSLFSPVTDNILAQWALYASLFVGVYKLVTMGLSFGSLVADLFVLPATNFAKYGATKGAWAVVTGASDGLGAEFARQLARKGFNVVLVSRTQSKLETIADEIETKFGVSTKIVAFDASVDSQANYRALTDALAGLHVTLLVNNVGQSHSIPVPFTETDPKELTDIITINNLVTLKITQSVLPAIEAATKELKVRGLVLTMGSFGGLFPTPYLATYSGSKAFLQQWSAALAGELASKNIDVELVLSYLVTSAMSKIRRTSLLIPNPKGFVAAALNKTGRRNGAQDRFATSTPYWTHAFMHYFVENTVGVYSKLANSLNLNMHKDIRRRALKKAEREKKAL